MEHRRDPKHINGFFGNYITSLKYSNTNNNINKHTQRIKEKKTMKMKNKSKSN